MGFIIENWRNGFFKFKSSSDIFWSNISYFVGELTKSRNLSSIQIIRITTTFQFMSVASFESRLVLARWNLTLKWTSLLLIQGKDLSMFFK